ncbi:MAG: hypothetical protein LPH21_13265 [Shewanella sp.]|nr:hypothetical protein [Shewanella sp.]MCF1430584.1 hypothetical protein [Shewanella sp.]MCF1458483.1 hypothetical protein [Shewanella sp.]
MDIIRRKLILGSSWIFASHFVLPTTKASTFFSPKEKRTHVYSLAEYPKAASLVKNGEFIPVTIGCAYKLITTIPIIPKSTFKFFLIAILPLIAKSKWNPTPDEHIVNILEPITKEIFFIERTQSEEEYEIAKNASLAVIKQFLKCFETLKDYTIDECDYILIRGTEKSLDIELNTDSLKISDETWVGIQSES